MKKKAVPSLPEARLSTRQPRERKQRNLASETPTRAVVDAAGLLSDLRSLIQSARQRIATVAHSTQTLLCWHVGRRLLNKNLQGGRAVYGKQILVTVSRELTAEYGRSFSYAEIARMSQFSQLFPDRELLNLAAGQAEADQHAGLVWQLRNSSTAHPGETLDRQFRHSRVSGNPGLFL